MELRAAAGRGGKRSKCSVRHCHRFEEPHCDPPAVAAVAVVEKEEEEDRCAYLFCYRVWPAVQKKGGKKKGEGEYAHSPYFYPLFQQDIFFEGGRVFFERGKERKYGNRVAG